MNVVQRVGTYNRRQLLAQAGGGAGLLALAALMADEGLLLNSAAADDSTGGSAADPRLNPLAPKKSHFPATAKSVIWLFMNGGPSHGRYMAVQAGAGKTGWQGAGGFDKNTGFFKEQVGPVMKSPFKFARYGESGAWVSEVFSGHGPARR